MTIRPDVEDIQTTRTEKLLAVVLAAFLLLGAIWTYQKIDDVVRHHVPVPTFGAAGPASVRLQQAQARASRASAERARALENLELRREAYRTALEAGQPAGALRARYDAAQRRFAAADREVRDAERAAAAARPAAEVEQRDLSKRIDAAYDRQQRDSFFARLGFIALFIVAAYGVLVWGRRRASRWVPLTGSVVAAATIAAFVFAADYLTDYLDPFDWGVAAIAGLGIASTLLVYWGVQRYLIRRIPQRRVKRHQCAFCGYPVGSGRHCEGCGREVVAPCTKCEAPRRVGTAYCAACGSASG
jgi:ABC-type multidrug transport system fused ATPase/permease subunit